MWKAKRSTSLNQAAQDLGRYDALKDPSAHRLGMADAKRDRLTILTAVVSPSC